MDQDIKTIKQTIFKYLDPKSVKAFIFGSRATNTAKKFSDYDVGLISPQPIKPELFYSIIDDLDNSDMLARVDLVDFQQVSEDFKKVALTKVIELN